MFNISLQAGASEVKIDQEMTRQILQAQVNTSNWILSGEMDQKHRLLAKFPSLKQAIFTLQAQAPINKRIQMRALSGKWARPKEEDWTLGTHIVCHLIVITLMIRSLQRQRRSGHSEVVRKGIKIIIPISNHQVQAFITSVQRKRVQNTTWVSSLRILLQSVLNRIRLAIILALVNIAPTMAK